MLYPKRALYAFLLAVLLHPISGRKGFSGLGRFKSNRHSYPKGGGLSGSGGGHGYVPQRPYNHNYQNSPPQTAPHYPMYHGPPPIHVSQYKNSGSKYGSLLAGLSLLNLGVLGASAYSHFKDSNKRKPEPGEVCKFEVKKDNGDYEQTKIDCQIISSFILQDQAQLHSTNSNVVPVNSTGIPEVSVVPESPLNVTPNVTGAVMQNGTVASLVVSTATTHTTLVNALDVKGKPVQVTPGMQCFVSRTSPTQNMRKSVPCGLLQTYADKSIQQLRNSAARNGRILSVMPVILAFCVAY